MLEVNLGAADWGLVSDGISGVIQHSPPNFGGVLQPNKTGTLQDEQCGAHSDRSLLAQGTSELQDADPEFFTGFPSFECL